MKKNTVQDIVKRYKVSSSGCHEWTGGGTEKNGYSRVRLDGERIGVHRVFYIHFKGNIPEGYEVDHVCANRNCVNVDHLEAVPPCVNIRRRKLNPSTHCLHGHLFNEKNTRIRTHYSKVDGAPYYSRLCRTCHRIAEHKRNLRKKEQL